MDYTGTDRTHIQIMSGRTTAVHNVQHANKCKYVNAFTVSITLTDYVRSCLSCCVSALNTLSTVLTFHFTPILQLD